MGRQDQLPIALTIVSKTAIASKFTRETTEPAKCERQFATSNLLRLMQADSPATCPVLNNPYGI
jgi:hypothetical protein